MNENYVSIKKACTITGLCDQTLRKLSDDNKIQSYKTHGGQRRFNKQCLYELTNSNFINKKIGSDTKKNFLYARVSSKKQSDDLHRQTVFISKPEYSSYILVTDIASGINFKRKGLSTILDACVQKNIGEIVVAHRDRLCRFGFELIKLFVEKSGGKITVIKDEEQHKSSEQELAEDLLSIVQIYSCKQMGKRSYRTKQQTQKS